MLTPRQKQEDGGEREGGGAGNVKALLISERSHNQPIVGKMERRGVDVVKLMPQNTREGRDDRQLLVLPKGHRAMHEFTNPSSDVMFPNVPYAKGT